MDHFIEDGQMLIITAMIVVVTSAHHIKSARDFLETVAAIACIIVTALLLSPYVHLKDGHNLLYAGVAGSSLFMLVYTAFEVGKILITTIKTKGR